MPLLGRAKVRRKLRALPEAVLRELKDQNGKNSAELVETMKGFAARDSKSGALVGSIEDEAAQSPSGVARRVKAGGERTRKPVRKSKKGNAPEYDYALANEYGTEDMAAQPFFWPAWRLKRRRFKSRMSRAGKRGIQKALAK